MADVIVAIVLLAIVALAVRYIVRAKKRGEGCIGCPNASGCGGHCSGRKEP